MITVTGKISKESLQLIQDYAKGRRMNPDYLLDYIIKDWFERNPRDEIIFEEDSD